MSSANDAAGILTRGSQRMFSDNEALRGSGSCDSRESCWIASNLCVITSSRPHDSIGGVTGTATPFMEAYPRLHDCTKSSDSEGWRSSVQAGNERRGTEAWRLGREEPLTSRFTSRLPTRYRTLTQAGCVVGLSKAQDLERS